MYRDTGSLLAARFWMGYRSHGFLICWNDSHHNGKHKVQYPAKHERNQSVDPVFRFNYPVYWFLFFSLRQVLGVFLKHKETPVVRASGRELSYVLLIGILLCYAASFLFVIRPTAVVCGIQRTAIGTCFSIVYAALLTKTNRISRIFRDGKKSAGRPGFISPKSQLAICGGLVSIQGKAWIRLIE